MGNSLEGNEFYETSGTADGLQPEGAWEQLHFGREEEDVNCSKEQEAGGLGEPGAWELLGGSRNTFSPVQSTH